MQSSDDTPNDAGSVEEALGICITLSPTPPLLRVPIVLLRSHPRFFRVLDRLFRYFISSILRVLLGDRMDVIHPACSPPKRSSVLLFRLVFDVCLTPQTSFFRPVYPNRVHLFRYFPASAVVLKDREHRQAAQVFHLKLNQFPFSEPLFPLLLLSPTSTLRFHMKTCKWGWSTRRTDPPDTWKAHVVPQADSPLSPTFSAGLLLLFLIDTRIPKTVVQLQERN